MPRCHVAAVARFETCSWWWRRVGLSAPAPATPAGSPGDRGRLRLSVAGHRRMSFSHSRQFGPGRPSRSAEDAEVQPLPVHTREIAGPAEPRPGEPQRKERPVFQYAGCRGASVLSRTASWDGLDVAPDEATTSPQQMVSTAMAGPDAPIAGRAAWHTNGTRARLRAANCGDRRQARG